MNGRDRFLIVAAAVKIRHAHATKTDCGNDRAAASKFSLFHVRNKQKETKITKIKFVSRAVEKTSFPSLSSVSWRVIFVQSKFAERLLPSGGGSIETALRSMVLPSAVSHWPATVPVSLYRQSQCARPARST